MYLFIIFLSVILWNFALIFGHIPHGRPSVGGSGALLIQKKLDSQRSASQRTVTQQISMRRTGPRTNSSKSRIGAGGRREAWPESDPPQPPGSFSHRGFSHSRPVYAGGHWQRMLFTHTPPFWQRRSSLSHTRAVVLRGKG